MKSAITRTLAYGWLAAASLTWALCPAPAASTMAGAKHQYASVAGYYVECLSLWPLIAYATLAETEAPRNIFRYSSKQPGSAT